MSAHIDEFTTNVEEVADQVAKLMSGELKPEELDHKMEIKETIKEIREREQREKDENLRKFGKEGGGVEEGCKWWCRLCRVDYFQEEKPEVCGRCGNDKHLVSSTSRREELLGKVGEMKERKADNLRRRDQFKRWLKSQRMLKRTNLMDYEKWSYWVCSSDDDSDLEAEKNAEPVVPKDSPEFQAMDKDMQERAAKRAGRKHTAITYKERGNAMLKKGDLLGALEEYNEGLSYARDTKELWTNKALVEIKLKKFEDAISSCSKVLEMCEVFEEGYEKSAAQCFKALLRRAEAQRCLLRWEGCAVDLREALSLPVGPKEKVEAQQMLQAAEEAMKEEKSAKEESRRDGEDATACSTPQPQDIIKMLSGQESQISMEGLYFSVFTKTLGKLKGWRNSEKKNFLQLSKLGDLEFEAFLEAIESNEKCRKKLIFEEKDFFEVFLAEALKNVNLKVDLRGDEKKNALRILKILVGLTSSPTGRHKILLEFSSKLFEFLDKNVFSGWVARILFFLLSEPSCAPSILEKCSMEKHSQALLSLAELGRGRGDNSEFALLVVADLCSMKGTFREAFLGIPFLNFRESLKSHLKHFAKFQKHASLAARVVCNLSDPSLYLDVCPSLLDFLKKLKGSNSIFSELQTSERILDCVVNSCKLSKTCCALCATNWETFVKIAEKHQENGAQPKKLNPSWNDELAGKALDVCYLSASSSPSALLLDPSSSLILLAEELLGDLTVENLRIMDAVSKIIFLGVQFDSSLLTPSLAEKALDRLEQLTPSKYGELGERPRIRGNMALMIQKLCDRQSLGGLGGVDLARAIPPLLASLRKDQLEAAKKNCAVALAKIGSICQGRYKEQLRAAGGMEALAGIPTAARR